MYEPAVVISNYNKNVSVYDTIDAISNSGFKKAFIDWYNKDWDVSQEEQLKYSRKKWTYYIRDTLSSRLC